MFVWSIDTTVGSRQNVISSKCSNRSLGCFLVPQNLKCFLDTCFVVYVVNRREQWLLHFTYSIIIYYKKNYKYYCVLPIYQINLFATGFNLNKISSFVSSKNSCSCYWSTQLSAEQISAKRSNRSSRLLSCSTKFHVFRLRRESARAMITTFYCSLRFIYGIIICFRKKKLNYYYVLPLYWIIKFNYHICNRFQLIRHRRTDLRQKQIQIYVKCGNYDYSFRNK